MVNVTGLPRMGRVSRNPKHSFQIRQRPYEITPFMIAPVLPGESLKNLLIQSRTVTDPIKNPLIGWWMEYYFFYIKHRDLDGREDYTAMMLDPSHDMSGYMAGADDSWKYTYNHGMDWVTPCLKRVVEEYFRNEGEAWNDYVITAGRPAARINSESWLQSTVDQSTVLLPDDPVLTVGVDGSITGSEIDATLRHWEFLRANDLINMTYEEWLGTYGVREKKEEAHIPELLRYVRDWKYPTNTVDPATGVPASAVSWVVSERADKQRYFREPGFVFGVSVARPKVYLQRQRGAAVGIMADAYTWLPAIMADDPATSLQAIGYDRGPLAPDTVHNYVTDVKDILLHGDQFVNFSLADTSGNLISLPNAALDNKLYPSSADANELFVATEANLVRSDGIVSLSIAGTQVDTTP